MAPTWIELVTAGETAEAAAFCAQIKIDNYDQSQKALYSDAKSSNMSV